MSHIGIVEARALAKEHGWQVDADSPTVLTRDQAVVHVWFGQAGRVSSVDLVADSNGDRLWRAYYPPGLAEKLTNILRSGNEPGDR